MTATPKFKMVCPLCGSDDVTADGVTRWNVETQKWELSDVYDGGHCGGCEKELKRFHEEPVVPSEGN